MDFRVNTFTIVNRAFCSDKKNLKDMCDSYYIVFSSWGEG
jgi:hypothetical protein